MEKKLHFHSDTELDKLINLLDHPEQLRMRIHYLKNSGHPLEDEVDGFIQFYDTHAGNCKLIKERLKLQENKLFTQLPVKKINWILIGTAASLMIILGTSTLFFLFKQQSKIPLNKPYEEIGLPNFMGENLFSKINWKEIMVLYKTNQFPKIISISNPAKNDTITYFQGVASFKLKNYKNGIQLFNEVETKSDFFNKSLYFKALCYYQLNKIAAFEKTISEIKLEVNDPAFNEKVKELKSHFSTRD